MKSLDELHALATFIITNKLPKDQIIFLTLLQRLETDRFLKNLGSSGVLQMNYKDTDVKCDTLHYGGITFYLIDTGYADKEPHMHDWAESKTYFGGKPDEIPEGAPYILSRYCENCGRTETYHGTEKRWIKTGYLKDCKLGE